MDTKGLVRALGEEALLRYVSAQLGVQGPVLASVLLPAGLGSTAGYSDKCVVLHIKASEEDTQHKPQEIDSSCHLQLSGHHVTALQISFCLPFLITG